MIIKKIHIFNFGKIRDLKIDLDDNLNLFYGENEAGKSTIVTFIKAMIYGFKNKKQRERIFPWNGATPRGELTIYLKGKEFLISRTFKESNSKDLIEVRDNLTLERLKEFNYKNIGERILGISENTFEKTLWVNQKNSSVINGGEEEITSKLSNLASTGDENISFDKALILINKKIKEINGKKGELPQTIENKKELIKRYEEIREIEEKYLEEEKRLEYLEEENKNLKLKDSDIFLENEEEGKILKEKLENLKKYGEVDESYLGDIIKLENEKENIEKEISRFKGEKESLYDIKSNLKKIREDMGDLIVFENITIEEEKEIYRLSKEADKETFLSESQGRKKQIESKIKNIDIKKFKYIFYGTSIFSIIFIILAIFQFKLPFIALGITFIIFTGISYFFYQKNYNEIRELRKSIRRISTLEDSELEENNFNLSFKLKEYKASSYEEFINNINIFKRKRLELEMYKEKLREKESHIESLGYNDILNKREELSSKIDKELLKYQVNSVKELIENYQIYNDTRQKYNDIILKNSRKQIEEKSEKILQNEKEMLNIKNYIKEFTRAKEEKIMVLEKLDENKKSKEILEVKLKALNLSKESLEKGFYELQKEFAPILNKKVEEIIRKITNNKYNKARVDNELLVTIEDDVTKIKKEIDNFSFGTIHQVYLALRLGIIKLIMEDASTIILDETFSQYDDARLFQVMNYISEDKNQYLIFTCQNREKRLLDDNNLSYNYIYLY